MSTMIAPSAALENAVRAAGLTLTALEPGHDFHGKPTVRAKVALPSDSARSETLELSESFDAARPEYAAGLAQYFAEAAERLKNPDVTAHYTVHGLPVRLAGFKWPFHGSTSGADTFIVHGTAHLADGTDTPLHTMVAASLTQTFAEVLPALEQPFAEGFIYNAVRKTFDQGQLELVKSGNRQPVPVSTRYYSAKQQRFIFNDTDAKQRKDFLAGKVFWLSHVLGGGAPVWIADPRDAQYLNTSVDELQREAAALVSEGLILLNGDWAVATDTLRTQEDEYRALLAKTLEFLKPSFNEELKHGKSNL